MFRQREIMEENFNIHLVSNVSHDTYPTNSPSQFSTLLANEISLKDDNWEVAVHDIMYPTKFEESFDNSDYIETFDYYSDKRKIFPQNVDSEGILQPWIMNVGEEFKSKYPAVLKPPLTKAQKAERARLQAEFKKARAKAAKKREELEKKNQEAKEEGKGKKKDEGKAKKQDEDRAKKKDEDNLNKEPVNMADRKRRRVQYKQKNFKTFK